MLFLPRRLLWICALPCAIVVMGSASGCVAPLSSGSQQVIPAEASYPQAEADRFPRSAPVQVEAVNQVAAPVVTVAASSGLSAPSVDDTKALGDALAALKAQGAIDAATQTQLLDGLQQTDPALWPQLLAYFRSAANRREPSAIAPNETKLASSAAPIDEPTPPAKKIDKPASPPKQTKPKVAKSTKSASGDKIKNKPKPEAADGDWRKQLATAIENLEKQTSQPPANPTEINQHAALRMLYLAAGRRDDALKPIAGIAPAQQDFWSKELYGLAAFLDHDRNPDASRRAAEANNHFREATARLGELATLQVRNLMFCSEVTSYGVYKPSDASEFQAGQELLLYAEIENFKSEHTDRGYHTALKASYQILDERGARVEEKEFTLTEEYCQNPRRDFFIRYFIWMPQRIYGGKYTLQLSLEDTLGQKIGQASLEFKIKGK